MFLLLRIVFWCAVSYVSCSISRYADGYNSTIERPLQPASGTVGFLHCSGWKSRRRPTPIGRALERALLPDGHPLSTVQASHVRLIYSLAKRIQNTKGGGDWDNGNVALWITARGSPGHVEGFVKPIWDRAPDEDDTDLGSRRRWGIHTTRRRLQSRVVSTVPGYRGWVASRRRRPYIGTTQCLAKEDYDPGHSPISWTLQNMTPSTESISFPDVCVDLHWIHNKRAARSSHIYTVEDVLQAAENIPHNVARCGLGGAARVRDGCRTFVSHLPMLYAANEVARSSQSNRFRSKVMIGSKAGEKEFASCHVELQVSDSIVALATTHKMSSSKLAFNFLGAEVAIQCEKIGIEGLKCSHIPGAANVVADFLSRPGRMAKEEFCT